MLPVRARQRVVRRLRTADETFVGEYTTTESDPAYYRITPAEEIADATVIWMEAGFALAAFDGDTGKQLLSPFSQSTAQHPSE